MDICMLSKENEFFFTDFIPKEAKEELWNKGVVGYGLYEEEQALAIGAMVFEQIGATAEIRSIYVRPEYRGMGGGTMLLDRIYWDAFESGEIAELELMLSEEDKNAELISLLETTGYLWEEAEEKNYIASLGELKKSSLFIKGIPVTDCVPLKNVTKMQLRKLEGKLIQLENLYVPLPINKEDYEDEVSTVILKKNEIEGILLASGNAKQGIVLDYTIALQKNSVDGLKLFYYAGQQAIQKYPEDAALLVAAMNETSTGILDKILPGAHVITCRRYYKSLKPLYERIYSEKFAD